VECIFHLSQYRDRVSNKSQLDKRTNIARCSIVGSAFELRPFVIFSRDEGKKKEEKRKKKEKKGERSLALSRGIIYRSSSLSADYHKPFPDGRVSSMRVRNLGQSVATGWLSSLVLIVGAITQMQGKCRPQEISRNESESETELSVR